MLKTNKRYDPMRLKKCLELAGARKDQFHVRWQCILGMWPGNGKGFVSNMKLSI